VNNLSFDKWIDYIFNREVTTPEWYWDKNFAPMKINSNIAILFLVKLFSESASILKRFSNAQVNQGIWYILTPGASGYIDSDVVSLPERKQLTESIYHFYVDCFAKRCDKKLSYTNSVENPLNLSCFMFWDLYADSQKIKGNNESLAIMQNILNIDHVACQESALHGLGHWYHEYSVDVETSIKNFLDKNPYISSKLVDYANKAANGLVQ
jgi:hypothetical protein